jgi:DNA-binding ferritin-like protein
MALTNIEYGSIASSKVLNDNFNYLESKMDNYTTDLNNLDGALTSAIKTQFDTLSNTLTKTQVNNDHGTIKFYQIQLQSMESSHWRLCY